MEFGCNSGFECINIDLRCDGKTDCADRSDEDNCEILQFTHEGYQKDIPPPRLIKDDNRFVKNKVQLRIDLIDLVEINEHSGFIRYYK